MISQKPTPFGMTILLTYSICAHVIEISEVSGMRTIAECYLINMLKISLFCHNARWHAPLSEIVIFFVKIEINILIFRTPKTLSG